MHPLRPLNKSKNQITFLKGSASNSAAMIATQALLVYCCSRTSEFSFLLEEVECVLPSRLVVLLNIGRYSWRVVLQVTRHYSLCPVNHEEGSEACRSVWSRSHAPKNRWQLLHPTSRCSFQGDLKSWLNPLQKHLIGALSLPVGLRMCNGSKIESYAVLTAEVSHVTLGEV